MEIITLKVGFYATNCYLVIKDDVCLIIDPGANANKISNIIEEKAVKPIAILLTHGHFDHIGAVDQLVNKYEIDVYIHQIDKAILKDKFANCSLRNREVIVNAPIKTGDIKMNIGNFKVDFIHLPGHTAGSCVILIENILFSGDVLFKNSIGRTDLPTANDKQMKQSLKYFKQLPKTIKVYPGHGEATTIKEELETNIYLR